MMHTPFTTGFGLDVILFGGLHMAGGLAFGIGLILLTVWACKHLSQHALWKWGWTLTLVGALVCLLTIMTLSFGSRRFDGGWGNGEYGMMGGYGYVQSADQTDSAAQAEEEAKGKALLAKVQSKQSQCADLADSDFELIGEYIMGLRTGASHEQMNTMIKRMMGEKGEEQVHINLGRITADCADGTTVGTGMMNGGMMRGIRP